MAVNPRPDLRAQNQHTGTLSHLRWPVRLTRAGLVAERATRAFWPLWSVVFVALAPVLMGLADLAPLEAVWGWMVLSVLAAMAALGWGLWRFRWPSRAEAVARVDARLPGRPIAAIADRQAIGAADPASRAVWSAHLDRMAALSRDARAAPPDLRVSDRDPFGLRFIALLFFITALLFGTFWRLAPTADVPFGDAPQIATGPTWEGWIEPPAHTGLPTLYLADLPEGEVEIMEGSEITLRLYGDPGALIVSETLSGRTGEPGSAAEAAQQFPVTRPGRLAIEGEGGAAWDVTLLADMAPTVAHAGEVEADALGQMAQPFIANDDFGVVAGTATIALDLPGVSRAHGLAPEPEPRAALVLDLPMPFTGARTEIAESLIDNLSEHPFANLPVTLTLSVTDAAGQTGATEPLAMTLPGRRFFQPMARAVIELRRDLLWSRANAPRVVRLMRAISHRPDDIFTNETTYLRMRFTLRRLDEAVQADRLTPEVTDEIAGAMWDLAVQLEDGTLADARERLQRAQDRLSEAMRNGASPEEIAELMQELREATDQYLDMLAQNAEPMENLTDEPQTGEQQGNEVTDDQIQAMMDRIQELMEEGRMAEAQELMDQLAELMENLQMQMAEGGQGGRRTPGEQSMEELGETLRDQQDLSDEAFRDLQDQFNGQQPEGQQQGQQGGPPQPGQPQGEQGQGQGQDPGQQDPGQDPGRDQGQDRQGRDGAGEGQDSEGSLAERQQALRGELERQRGNLPGLTGEQAQAAREALERAERAMDRAEDALRDGDLPGAIDNQALAMDLLREGLRNLGQALADNRDPDAADDSAEGQGQGRTEPARRDPLGRQPGEGGQFGTDQNLLQGEDVYRRAEEILEELRRRAGEQERPEVERDYLRRLLEQF